MRIKTPMKLSLAASLICVGLSVYTALNESAPAILKTVTGVAAVVFSILMISLAMSSEEYPRFLPEYSSAGPGIAALLTAAAYGYLGVVGLINKELRFFTVTETFRTAVMEGDEVTMTDIESGVNVSTYEMLGVIYTVLLIVAAITFLVYAVGFFKGDNVAGTYVLLPIMPILCLIMRLVLSFLENTRSQTPGKSGYEMLMLIFLMLFLVSSGKLTVGSSGKASKWAAGTGAAAVLFDLISLVKPVMTITDSIKSNGAVNISELFSSSNAAVSEVITRTHFVADLAIIFFIASYLRYSVSDASVFEDFDDEDEENPAPRNRISSRPTLLTGGRASESDQRYIPEIAMVQPILPSPKTSAPGSGMQVSKSSGTMYSSPVPPRRDAPAAVKSAPTRSGSQRAGYSAPVPPRRVPIGYRLEADELTTKGAGMQVAEEFSLNPGGRRRRSSVVRYDGLDAFRGEMKGGKTAMDILESSVSESSAPEVPEGIKPVNPFSDVDTSVTPETAAESVAAAAAMGEELEKEVDSSIVKIKERRSGKDRRSGDRVGGRRSTDKQPEEEVIASPDESGPEDEEEEIAETRRDEYRDVRLSEGGSLNSKLKKQQHKRKTDRQPETQEQTQTNPFAQQMGMGAMGMGFGMGMNSMGMGAMGMNGMSGMSGMGMGMNPMGMNGMGMNPMGMGMNNPYDTSYGNSSFGGNDAEDEEEEYYDDEYDYDEEAEDEYGDYDEYDEGEYDEYAEDGEYDDYGDEYDDYGDGYGDEYEEYDEGEYEEYGDEEYYDDGDDGYGTYDLSNHGWN